MGSIETAGYLAASSRRPSGIDFEEFVDGSSSRLFSMAMLLTGRHRAEAEDLLQSVLERAYRRWHRICRNGDPEPYVRQMLVNAATDRWRRIRRRPEQSLPGGSVQADSGDARLASSSDAAEEIADRDLLLRALAELSAGQRAVLVLRYFADLSEVQTAQALGCSVGSVKTQAARGLARLRVLTGDAVADTGGRDD